MAVLGRPWWHLYRHLGAQVRRVPAHAQAAVGKPRTFVDAAVQGVRDLMGLETGADVPACASAGVKMGAPVAADALLER